MKIGFVLPAGYAVIRPGDGRRAQAMFQADALERIGHTMVRLNPWEINDIGSLDALHIIEGAYGNYTFIEIRPDYVRLMGVAPFIDSNQPNWRYRLMTRLGTMYRALTTGPGLYRRQMEHCDLVIVRSVHERERVIRGIGIDPQRIGVEIVLNGVNPPTPADPEIARRRFDLPRDYLLHVGIYSDPRKNALRMVEAVGPTGLPLVMVGAALRGDVLERLKTLAQRYKNIKLLEYVDQPMLNSLYAGCKVFCLPSIHEGTGLAALEAAAYGAGVVITKYGGPPDYFRDLAYYVDPYDVANIRATILQAWENPRGQEVKQHVVSNLTWDQSARSLVAAYQKHMKK